MEGVEIMDETINFFQKMLTKCEWNLRYAEGAGRTEDAENIRKKVKHYKRGLEALEKVNEEKD